MDLERYARHEERTVYEVWDIDDFHDMFDTEEDAQAYIDRAEYPGDYEIIEALHEVKVYDIPEQDRF